MRIISKRRLIDFYSIHADAKAPLEAWYFEAKHAKWLTPQDIKLHYPSASIIENNRMVFNIKGNTYRLVCAIRYDLGIVYIRFIGTHSQYDKIDAKEI